MNRVRGWWRGGSHFDVVAVDRWEVVDRDVPPGKTVRAEVDLPRWLSLVGGARGTYPA